MNINYQQLKFNPEGLIPAILQDADSHQVLMMAWMNREAVEFSITTGEAYFWSRSRQELWHKGGTSGNIQKVIDIQVDCDADTLLIHVKPQGPACHTGNTSCFFRAIEEL